MIREVMYEGNTIKLHLEELEDVIEQVKNHFDDILKLMEEDYDIFYPLYETNTCSDKSDVVKERERIFKKLNDLYSNVIPWEDVLEDISVKKNGRFRKNGVSKFIIVESATNFFTEYTNAWDTLVIQLSALNENEVKMIVKSETFTH